MAFEIKVLRKLVPKGQGFLIDLPVPDMLRSSCLSEHSSNNFRDWKAPDTPLKSFQIGQLMRWDSPAACQISRGTLLHAPEPRHRQYVLQDPTSTYHRSSDATNQSCIVHRQSVESMSV